MAMSMTLEKLLIFGFAIAVATALAVAAANIKDRREPQKDRYQEQVRDMLDRP